MSVVVGPRKIQIPPSYLVDDYSPAVAYSLRKLSSSATVAIRVRRSSDNAEQDIGFSGNDLDTASLLSFVGAGDGFVTTWYDQSGNGHNVTQSTLLNQPNIVSSGSLITMGGLPAVNSITTGLKFLSIVKDGSANHFSFSVLQHNGNNASISYGGVNKFYALAQSGGGSAGVSLFGTPTIWINSSILSTYPRSVFYTEFTNRKILTAKGDSSTWTTLNIGASVSGYTMYRTQEYIIFFTDQSANRTAIESNINDYYGIY